MYKSLTILFLTATMAQAQTTLLCEDNFTTDVAGCNIATTSTQNFQKKNGAMHYNSTNSLSNQKVSVLFSNSLSDYDTLLIEMNLTINDSYTKYRDVSSESILGIFVGNFSNSIYFNYTEVATNKNYNGVLNEYLPFRYDISLLNAISSYSNNKLVTKIANPTGSEINFMNIFPREKLHNFNNATWGTTNLPLYGHYINSIYEDQGFVYQIKQAFCSTTGNPTDCEKNVNISETNRFESPLQFEIDNFKAFGIKKMVTGLEEEIKTLNTRTLVGMYNSLGQKLDTDQIHEGLVIKMYSDGTKEKVAMK